MQNCPILFLNPLGPTPEMTLPDSRRSVRRKILAQVKTIASDLIDDESHLVPVLRNNCASFNLRRKICRCNLSLPHGHVAHLGPVEVCAITDGVYPVLAGSTHGQIHVDVTFFVCDPEV